jgi:hypothetical protein
MWCLALREEHRLGAFEKKVVMIIFGPKRDEVAAGWRRLQNEELSNLYASQNIITVIKSSKLRWAGHVVYMGQKRNKYKLLVWKSKGKKYSQDLDVDGRIILGWVLEKEGGRCGLNASGSGYGPVAGTCKHCN